MVFASCLSGMFSNPRSTIPPLRKLSSGGTVPKLVCGASFTSISTIGSSRCFILSWYVMV